MSNSGYMKINTEIDIQECIIENNINGNSSNDENDITLTDNSITIRDSLDDNEVRLESIIKQEQKPKRVYWVDWLRVFASMLVVYIHCSGIALKPRKLFSYNWNVLFFHNSIPRPAVPLFLMISGIFFLNPKRKLSYKKLYKKNVVRLIKCYVVWVLYYKIINTYIINYTGRKYVFNMDLVKQALKNIITIRTHEHLWYLRTALYLYILTPLFRIISARKKLAWMITIFFIIFTQFIPTVFYYPLDKKNSVHHILDITGNISFGVYFFMGYLLYDYTFSKRIYVYLIELIGFASIFLTIHLRFMACHRKNKENNDFGSTESFNVALSAYGIFTFFQYTVNDRIEPLMKKRNIKKVIMKMSECSFGVYLTHMTVYHFFYRIGLHSQTFNPVWWVIVYSALVYVFSFILTFLLIKIPFVKSII